METTRSIYDNIAKMAGISYGDLKYIYRLIRMRKRCAELLLQSNVDSEATLSMKQQINYLNKQIMQVFGIYDIPFSDYEQHLAEKDRLKAIRKQKAIYSKLTEPE